MSLVACFHLRRKELSTNFGDKVHTKKFNFTERELKELAAASAAVCSDSRSAARQQLA